MKRSNLLSVLAKRRQLALGAFCFGLAIGALTFLLRPPVYTSTIQFYVSSQVNSGAQTAYQGAQLSQQRVASYVELITSLATCNDVATTLNSERSPTSICSDLSASGVPDSVLIDVNVDAESPGAATQIANAVGAVFPNVVRLVERTSNGTSPVEVRAVDQAEAPSSPSSAGLATLLALGALLGAGLAVLATLAREATDQAVRSGADIAAALGTPLLGEVISDTALDGGVRGPMVPTDIRAEGLRQIRTNLVFVDVDHAPRVLCVTSARSEEGKTTLALDLASALDWAGDAVVVLDADLRRPSVADRLELDGSIGLSQVLAGNISISKAVQRPSGCSYSVVTSGPIPPNPSELLSSDRMKDLIRELRARYDHVIIDTPPVGQVIDAAGLAPLTDGAVVCARYGVSKRNAVEVAYERLAATGSNLIGLVLTMVSQEQTKPYGEYRGYKAYGQPVKQKTPSE